MLITTSGAVKTLPPVRQVNVSKNEPVNVFMVDKKKGVALCKILRLGLYAWVKTSRLVKDPNSDLT
ncbi:hypothetical protein KAR91_83835 [Candidatus Pacearchaeota archaeon]|nr:hypothetical protein [Candidatus Pacearchaeota archaeon]